MAHTLATARTSLREDILNDPQSVHWTDAQLDRSIQVGLVRALGWYISEGGDAFTTEAALSSVSGEIDVSSYDIRRLVQLQHVQSNARSPVGYIRLGQGWRKSTVNEDFMLVYDVLPTKPSADGDALVASTYTFDELEELVILEAARRAAIKDREGPLGLGDLIDDLRKDVHAQRHVIRVAPPARPNSSVLSWTFNRSTNKLELFEALK